MSQNSNIITIPLELSGNATANFGRDNLIQFEAYEQITQIILNNQNKIKQQVENDTTRYHEAITVLGNRGSGKTSFLLNLESYMDASSSSIAFLKILDPTLFESKQHVLLTVITRIINFIEERKEKQELNHKCEQQFNKSLENLADGIGLLDGIDDNTNHKSIWDDSRINFSKGLTCSKKGLNFEEDFKTFIKDALLYLKKTMFIIMFDDIDTNVEKGWPVLEVIRKYLTVLEVQVIISGDWALFSKLVRINQLTNLKGLKDIEEECNCENRYSYLESLDILEEQYLTKILKPENRIILRSLEEIVNKKELNLQLYNDQIIKIENAYRNLFNYSLALINNTAFNNFKAIFFTLPLRSNIQLLNAFYKQQSYESFIDDLGRQFLTHLTRYNISMYDLYSFKDKSLIYKYLKKSLEIQALQKDIKFQELLSLSSYEINERQERNILFYVLKSTVTATINKNKSLLFEWMFRIELFKHSYEDKISLEQDLNYLGYGTLTSARDFAQRLNGYSEKFLKDYTQGYIGVYKDQSKMRSKSYQHLEQELSKNDNSALVIINLMFSQVTRHNTSQVDMFGSIYYLLGAISEILALPNDSSALRQYFNDRARISTVYPYSEDNHQTTIFFSEMSKTKKTISNKLIEDFEIWLDKKDQVKEFPLDILEKTITDFLLFQEKMPQVQSFAEYITLQSIYFLRALLGATSENISENEIITFQRIKNIEHAKRMLNSAIKKYKDSTLNKDVEVIRIFDFIYDCPIWKYILEDKEYEEDIVEEPTDNFSLGGLFVEEEVNIHKDTRDLSTTSQPLITLLEGLKVHGSKSEEQEGESIEALQDVEQETENTVYYPRENFTYEQLLKIFHDDESKLTSLKIDKPEELTPKIIDKYRQYLIKQYFGRIRLDDEMKDELTRAISDFNQINSNV